MKGSPTVRLLPATRDEAMALVDRLHRHHPRHQGHRFAIAAELGGELVGAAIVGRPTSHVLQQDKTCAEVVRLVVKEHVCFGPFCLDALHNLCSRLYGAAWRAWKAMGGRRMVTYTLATEPGTSLRAAGATFECETRGGSWDRPSRARQDKAPTDPKHRWGWTA